MRNVVEQRRVLTPEYVRSAQGFLTFMSGYTVFLGPFAGIMVTDVRFSPFVDLPSTDRS